VTERAARKSAAQRERESRSYVLVGAGVAAVGALAAIPFLVAMGALVAVVGIGIFLAALSRRD